MFTSTKERKATARIRLLTVIMEREKAYLQTVEADLQGLGKGKHNLLGDGLPGKGLMHMVHCLNPHGILLSVCGRQTGSGRYQFRRLLFIIRSMDLRGDLRLEPG